MGETILVTGGAGFIGSNFIRYVLQVEPELSVVNLDALTYAGNLANLADLAHSERYHFVYGRIQDTALVERICRQYNVTGIINFAAESHVDRSIHSAAPFIDTNVVGVLSLLEVVRRLEIPRFVQVSTDEVYGSVSHGFSTEEDPLRPNSPYAASKASADLLVRSYVQTYGVPAIITRASNNYGPYQFPEKLIPLMITNAIEEQPLPVYGDGQNVRDWLFVEDHCDALWQIYRKGRIGEIYNIASGEQRRNIEVVEMILSFLQKPTALIRFVADRPGHDRRYALDTRKIREELGWQPKVSFEQGLQQTIQWYLENRQWWEAVKDQSYRAYYQQQYGILSAEDSNG